LYRFNRSASLAPSIHRATITWKRESVLTPFQRFVPSIAPVVA